MKIVLFGASGLVGGLLVPLLGAHDLTVAGRRATGTAGERVAPLEDWPALIAKLEPKVAISTLGTTIRRAGSQAAFAAVDHDAVLAVASAAKAAGVRQFLTVSSVGADARSSNFYLKTKGTTEADLIALAFERVDIFRPGLLLGERAGEPRLAEQLAATLSPLTNALTPRRLDRYRAIEARDVARAIAQSVGAPSPGVHVHHNREMLESARHFA